MNPANKRMNRRKRRAIRVEHPRNWLHSGKSIGPSSRTQSACRSLLNLSVTAAPRLFLVTQLIRLRAGPLVYVRDHVEYRRAAPRTSSDRYDPACVQSCPDARQRISIQSRKTRGIPGFRAFSTGSTGQFAIAEQTARRRDQFKDRSKESRLTVSMER